MVGHVRLGGTGVEVSELCLGSWMFGTRSAETDTEIVDQGTASSILDAAWERGVNFVRVFFH